jgi:REP element-mobilizing transposase RayT
MMIFNPGKYHRRSVRLQGYDYSRPGLYFITICCHNRVCLFGEIADGVENPQRSKPFKRMVLNDAGNFANNCWLNIPAHFPNVRLHAHIIMPNHVHGIIELGSGNEDVASDVFVGVENFQPLRMAEPRRTRNEFQKIIPRSVGSIVRGFKTGVTKWFHQNTDVMVVWQRNFYEHIIRDEKAYQAIAEYIITNPIRWDDDKLFDT